MLDNDVLGAAGRAVRGIEVNADTLSFAEIEHICSSGEGHYLGSGNTLQVMQSEYIYPDFSDRTSPTIWEELGKPVLLDRAIEKDTGHAGPSCTAPCQRRNRRTECGPSFRSFSPGPRRGDDGAGTWSRRYSPAASRMSGM